MTSMVFIYAKDGKIIVLNPTDSREQHKGLIEKGYVHTHSIDVCLWIEHLHNICEDKIKAIKELNIRS